MDVLEIYNEHHQDLILAKLRYKGMNFGIMPWIKIGQS